MTSVIYLFEDSGVPGACKIGKDEKWPSRYKQARCHTPRGITVKAIFMPVDKDATRIAESAAKRALARYSRSGDVNEWFNLPAHEAIEHLEDRKILRAQDRQPISTPALPESARLYDDWREQGAKFKRLRWHLWLFRENSSQPRLKLSYGALYDTAYHYAFTYNPWPVRLIAGFEHEAAIAAEHPDNERPNAAIRRAWESVQTALGNPVSEQVGWLQEGTTARHVAERLAAFGIRPFPLDRPKPDGARARDPSVNPPVATGSVPRLGRVEPSEAIYGDLSLRS